MNKNLHFKKFTLFAIASMLSVAGCKKEMSPSPEENVTPSKFKTLSASDGKYDLLGYGLNVTGDMLDRNSVSDAPIINMEQFANDYLYRLDIGNTGSGVNHYYLGATALEYIKDVSDSKSFNAGVNQPKIEGADKAKSDKLFKGGFNASFGSTSTNQNKNTYLSTYSYATYEVNHPIKRLRFNDDVDISLLMNYLTPDFLNNVANKSANELIERYGTHVMLDITIGGRLKFDYSGSIQNQIDYNKKTSDVKIGLGVGLIKSIGININSDKSTTEINQATTNTTKKSYSVKYYGGTNSGMSVAIDKDGNSSQTINLASFEQSVNPTNAALIDVENAVYLYNFIADPVKKEQVKAATEKYIQDNQITLVQDYTNELVPINSYEARGDHYLTAGTVNDPNYWKFIGQEFRAYPRQVPGSVPVNVYFSQKGVDHFYTTGTINDSWWRSEGVSFYAYTTKVDGTIPVYLHTSRDGQDHYFSASSVVFDTGYWSPSVSVAFYAYPM